MIAKGNLHNNGPSLARYLTADSKGNERSEVGELRGFATDNIFDALALIQLQSQGTHCQKPIFHTQVRLPKEDSLTRAQWLQVADRIEGKLGFKGQPRVVVFHQKEGKEHMHVAWSRIGDDMRAIDPGLYKLKLKEVCRQLEKEMGLQQVKNERDADERTKPANRGEFEESRRLKTDLNLIRETIRDCYEKSCTAPAFIASLEDNRLILAKGDKRSFVIVDEKGGKHALSKRITGQTMNEMRAHLSGLGSVDLPSIEQAEAIQRERPPQGEKEIENMAQEQDKPEKDREKIILEEEEKKQKAFEEEQEKLDLSRKEDFQKDEERKAEALKEDDERLTQSYKDEDDRKQKAFEEDQHKQDLLREESFKEEEARRATYKEQAERQTEQTREMEAQQRQHDATKAGLRSAYNENNARQAEENKKETWRESLDALDIRNPHSRYGQALAQHYDIRDPYRSLARSSMAEYGSFLRDRENLQRQIAEAKDPDQRKALEIRQRIESAEYMAITSNRIAAQSEIIVGRRNTEEAVRQRARAEAFQKEAKELREQYRTLQESRTPRQGESREKKVDPPARVSPEPEPKEPPQKEKPVENKASEHGLMVEERQPGKPRGQAQSLDDFVKDLPTPPQERKVTYEETKNDPAAKKAYYTQMAAEKNRANALDNMDRDRKSGLNLNKADIRNLSREDIEGLKAKSEQGKTDDHLKELMKERAQERERDKGRER